MKPSGKLLLYAQAALLAGVVVVFASLGPSILHSILVLPMVFALGGISLGIAHRLWSAEKGASRHREVFIDLFSHSLDGIAVHQMFFDAHRRPIDYVFLEVNSAFEDLTDLRAENIVGKRVTEVLPGIEKAAFIERYGQVVLTGEPLCFEQFSAPLRRHYRVAAYSMGEDRFATVFEDITKIKETEAQLQRTSHWYQHIVNTQEEMICRFRPDATLSFANAAYQTFFNIASGDVPKTSFFDKVPSHHHEGVREHLQRLADGLEPKSYEHQVEVDEEIYWQRWKIFPLFDADNNIVEFQSVGHDITAYKQMERSLRESEDKFRSLFAHCPDGIVIMDLQGAIVDCNEQAARMHGYTRQELIGSSVSELIAQENDNAAAGDLPEMQVISQHIEELRERGPARLQLDHRRKDGSVFPVESSMSLLTIQTREYCIGFDRDASARKQAEQDLEYLTFHDALTGLYNRRFFDEELRRLDVKRNVPLTLVMLDVNGLKLTNDAFGHAAGDRLLQGVATGLQQACRSDDIIARIGGDEFVILLPRTDEKQASDLTNRIRKELLPVRIESVPISLSYGWGTKRHEHEDMRVVYKQAEDAMYQQKIAERSSRRHESIQLIMTTLYEKSPREQEHSYRVSRLSRRLASALGLPDYEVQNLQLAGVLHDIGKIAISDQVLDKAGPLTDQEWVEMRRHPEVGYSILSAVNDYALLADYVVAHHERWDGVGYPKGLKGEEIPVPARILAIVDTYDAMTSNRPYRRGMSHEDTLEEITVCAGFQFDPHIVEVFLQVMQEEEETAGTGD